ncbi:TIGR03085 family metal-binding protein [Kitasatospora sp. NPDC002227]|uniref:TIGR03085 family metal-binding protein n=1 Tax=Kitasatospora sp. NPDC002227 TaxID=3154773 RepID=UPI0033211530
MPHFARTERHRLADLLTAAGPDAPTLCGGWTTRDLAAHLVLRERRPDAAAGIQLKPLAGWTDTVQRRYAAGDFAELVHQFRSGPPRFSLFGLPGADEAANTVEYFVHAEDVRRAVAWEPEELTPGLDEALWKRLPMLTRFETARKSPVRLVLKHPDGRSVTVADKHPMTVELTGTPGELILFAFGRGARTKLQADGTPEALAALRKALPF